LRPAAWWENDGGLRQPGDFLLDKDGPPELVEAMCCGQEFVFGTQMFLAELAGCMAKIFRGSGNGSTPWSACRWKRQPGAKRNTP
jgi:hypothetical protein